MVTSQAEFQKWFVDSLAPLRSNGDAGFVFVLTAFPLLERYLRRKSGCPDGQSLTPAFFTNLGLTFPENIIAKKKVRNEMGKSVRGMINLVFYLSGRRIKTVASLAKRSDMRVKMIVGRRDLSSFLVKSDESEVAKFDWYKNLWTRKKS